MYVQSIISFLNPQQTFKFVTFLVKYKITVVFSTKYLARNKELAKSLNILSLMVP